MKNPIRIQSPIKPQYIEKLGNNTYYYNYDIQEFQTTSQEEGKEGELISMYSFIQVYLYGIPDYKKCIQSIIRAFIDEHEEFALINKYNRYLTGLEEDTNSYNEYVEYLNKVSQITSKVRKDFKIPEKPISREVKIPNLEDLITLNKILIKTANLTDSESLDCKAFYDAWDLYIGKALEAGTKVTYNGKLFKVRQKINKVEGHQPPSISTAALYEEIVEGHEGTRLDPIPYNKNQELFEGKYYSQNGEVYKCIRNSGQPLYHDLSALVGNYVQKV